MSNYQLLRGARVWISLVNTGFTPLNTQELLVQDDLTFNQTTSSTDITISEAGPIPTRGSKRYNDALDPADWSFSTYLLPYLDANTNKVLLPDYLLWHSLATGKPVDLDTKGGLSSNATNMMLDFTENSFHELAKFNIYILMDSVWYEIENCQAGQAEINIDIEDIGRVTWSGNGTKINKLDAAPFDPQAILIDNALYAQLQGSYLKNKLTIVNLKDQDTGKLYDIPITGGSFTINNNITYLTPNVMSKVNVPIGSFTGAFELTGSLTAYLSSKAGGSVELYEDIVRELSAVNRFRIAIMLGGKYDIAAPGTVLVANQAQITVPSIETDDVLGTTIEFKAIPSDLDTGDEGYLAFGPSFTSTIIDKIIEEGDGDPSTSVPATGVTLNYSAENMSVGDKLQLIPNVLPTTATNKNVTYSTDDAAVATVTTTGEIEAVATGGPVIITCTTEDGSHTATVSITVT